VRRVNGSAPHCARGTEELTRGLDLTPSLRPENLRRLQLALDELDAKRTDRRRLVLDAATIRDEPIITLRSPNGELKIVPEPPGTRGGYDDLRRAASREPIGKCLRPTVASISDLARMAATLNREQDLPKLRKLRELERGLNLEIDR
jgi:hypothetical protein